MRRSIGNSRGTLYNLSLDVTTRAMCVCASRAAGVRLTLLILGITRRHVL